jgi:hypothetical protein
MAITKYSVDDYEEMIRLGVLTEKDRGKLIRGRSFPRWPSDRGIQLVSKG